MALNTYTTLQAAIASWANRSDLSSAIVDAIRLVEADLDLDKAIQDEVRAEITLDSEEVALPAACREVKALYFDTATLRGPIAVGPEQDLPDWKTVVGLATGAPTRASIVNNGTVLRLSPIPDQAYTARIKYLAYLTPLSTSPSNWILERHPNIYLYGALVELMPFLKDDERMPLWESRFNRALSRLKDLIDRRRFSANTLSVGPKRPLDR